MHQSDVKCVNQLSRNCRKELKTLMDLASDEGLHTGSRIRERRMDQKIRQADLAVQVGISPSYLNLIEHNRRRIGGALLADIARALGIEPTVLSQGAARAVLDQLNAAAAMFTSADAELSRAEEVAARFPGWTAVIAAQNQRLAALGQQVQMLSDRMTHDPALAASLHGVISAVTSIRSTAAILTSDEAIDADWQDRFHRNMHDDAVKLAQTSEALMAYLVMPDDAAGLLLSPVEEVETWIEDQTDFNKILETGTHVDEIMASAQDLSDAGQKVLKDQISLHISDIKALPLKVIVKLARENDYDPIRIFEKVAVDLPLILRRLARLPVDDGHPPMGLATCDAGGYLRMLQPVPDFVLPRGSACPMWPIFTALGQAGRPVLQDVVLPGAPEVRMRCTAIAQIATPKDYALPPMVTATMLVRPDPSPDGQAALPLGISCRICPRIDCAARREPSALTNAL